MARSVVEGFDPQLWRAVGVQRDRVTSPYGASRNCSPAIWIVERPSNKTALGELQYEQSASEVDPFVGLRLPSQALWVQFGTSSLAGDSWL